MKVIFECGASAKGVVAVIKIKPWYLVCCKGKV